MRTDDIIEPGQIWREVDTKGLVRILRIKADGNVEIRRCDQDGTFLPNSRVTIAAYYRFATQAGTRSGADFLLGVRQ